MQLRCQQERTQCQNLWVETTKTPTLWKAKWTVRGYEEPKSDEGCFAATATTEGVPMVLAWCVDMRDNKGHEASVRGYTQAFLISAVRDGEQHGGSRNIFWTGGGVVCGRCGKHCQACGRHCDGSRNTFRDR